MAARKKHPARLPAVYSVDWSMSSRLMGFQTSLPNMTWLEAQTRFPAMATMRLDMGKPKRLPRSTSFFFCAYRWKSAALEAKVAQLDAPRRKNWTMSQVRFEPVAVPGCEMTAPRPPALVAVQAIMAMAETVKTPSLM